MTGATPDSSRRGRIFLVFALGGAALLTGLASIRLPSPRVWLRAPETLFDRSEARHIRAPFLLLQKAAGIVPEGASVVYRAEPANAVADTSLFRLAVALLPGRRVLPAAMWDTPMASLARSAEFVILYGSFPSEPPGRLLLSTPEGTIWRRRP